MSELYRPSDRRLSAKLVPTFADRGRHMVSVTNSYSRIHGFLYWSRYIFFQLVPQLYSRGLVNPFPDPLLVVPGIEPGPQYLVAFSYTVHLQRSDPNLPRFIFIFECYRALKSCLFVGT
jgi:hypothetical protein